LNSLDKKGANMMFVSKKITLFVLIVLFVLNEQLRTQIPQRIIPQIPGVSLSLNIEPPTSTEQYQFDRNFESTALTLKFSFIQMSDPNVSNIDPQQYRKIPLYGLRYRVYANYGELELFEKTPFFEDTIDLYGKFGPGSLEVSPGIFIPISVEKIKIEAELACKKILNQGGYIDHIAKAATEIDIQRHPINGTLSTINVNTVGKLSFQDFYNLYRTGYIRRHLLDSGRGLSWTWLKEYKPGVDRKELLYHSRTFNYQNVRTRVYIPWLYKCDGKPCGQSVAENAYAIHGEAENPLLRGGLAMATFAQEYMNGTNYQDKHKISLNHALKLLDYFEKCEWIDKEGERTGFFLRSRYPHYELYGREYYFASTDEIVGMTLGLYYLHQALKKAGDSINKNRVEQLVDRLATRLQENYYFIVPLRCITETITLSTPHFRPPVTIEKHNWVPIGLPLERHKGWSASYFLQWYLAGGFRAITGKKYRPFDPQLYESIDLISIENWTDVSSHEINHPFWAKVSELKWVDNDDDDLGFIPSVAGYKPNDRALYYIKGMGLVMYYQEEGEFRISETEAPEIVIDFWDSNILKRYNYAYLLHTFQLGMAGEEWREEARVKLIKYEMAKLINGILSEGGSKTSLDLKTLAINLFGVSSFDSTIWKMTLGVLVSLYDAILGGLFMDTTITVKIGTHDAEYDLYSPIVAWKYNLPEVYAWFESLPTILGEPPQLQQEKYQDALEDFNKTLSQAWNGAITKFMWSLPCGERNLDGAIKHNPLEKWGKAFVWESSPSSRVQTGGRNGDANLENDDITESLRQCTDVMNEGAGMGYLFPAALFANSMGIKLYFLKDELNFPYLKACFTLPVHLARLDRRLEVLEAPCQFKFPSYPSDEFDIVVNQMCDEDARIQRNDSYFSAKEIEWKYYENLTIDKRSHSDYLGLGYGKYTSFIDNKIYEIALEGDFDYYYLTNGFSKDVRLDVECTNDIKIFIDGEEARVSHRQLEYLGEFWGQPAYQLKYTKSVIVPGKSIHIIYITGPLGKYSMNISSLPSD
jgi:hypothetical protein